MKQTAAVRSGCLGVTLPLIWAAVLLQGFASAQTNAAPALHENPGRPEQIEYKVKDSNNTVCLMAKMGLQINITYISTSQNKIVQNVFNLQSNVTNGTGSCESESASLSITDHADKISIGFIFTLNTTSRKYHLSEVSVSAALPDMKEHFFAQNRSLDYMRGTLGYSFKCHGEQTLNVTQNASINTFLLQVQPFGVKGDSFGEAEECQLDEDDLLIPIIVGAALAGLVLIVLLAYLIGRKRSHAGYQSI